MVVPRTPVLKYILSLDKILSEKNAIRINIGQNTYCYVFMCNYIPRRKSGIYWIQVRRAAATAAAAAAAVEISLWTR